MAEDGSTAFGSPKARPTGPKLLRPRWIFGHLLAAGLVALFIALGLWQVRRLDQRQAHNAIVIERSARQALPLDEALAESEAAGEVLEYLPVTVEGEFAPEHEVLLRGRSIAGQPGFNVLTPLVLDGQDGTATKTAVLVERGWVPYENDSVPVIAAPPPAGDVEVAGRLRAPTTRPPGASGRFAPRDPTEGALVQTYYVDVQRLAMQMPFELLGAYVQRTGSEPPQPAQLPLPLPEPEVDEGPHRGYAIQWFSFAVIGVVGYAILLRKVWREG
ncbi:MAG TPA: SURF1 family protein [Trueperaceae bacterium]|nr:SURF1 family protein [Trueperaceae bacterium]